MPKDPRQANKLLRDIGLPSLVQQVNAADIERIKAILFDPRYWDETVLARLLDRCDAVLCRTPNMGLLSPALLLR